MNRRAGVVVLLLALAGITAIAVAAHRSSEPGELERSEDVRPRVDSEPITWAVAPWGSDDARGDVDEPLGSLEYALKQLRAGDTLVVRGGVYEERVSVSVADIGAGTPEEPVSVQAASGERPVVEGLLWLEGADHWTIRGIDVTWSDRNDPDEHMVKFTGGTGWRYTDAEVWGARSFAAILVTNGATDFRLDRLHVHDTHPTNDANQDHLIYLSRGNRGGVVERNLLVGSPNGRGIKVGPGSPDEEGTDGTVIRYNTFLDNTGPSNIRFSGDSTGNLVYRNLLVGSAEGEPAVSAFDLSGTDNVVRDNAAWDAAAVVEETQGLVDGGGNVMIDPRFDPDRTDLRPSNPAAARYGAWARM